MNFDTPPLKVSEMRLELTRSNDHYPLKVARLPIPPSGQLYSPTKPQAPRGATLTDRILSNNDWKRAKNGTRTRDPDLGKVVLYQLSYFRILRITPGA